MAKRLTDDQIKQYHSDGYVHPVAVLSDEEVREARAAIEAFEAKSGKLFDYPEKSKSYLLFDWADRLVRHPAILDAVEDIIGPDIMVYHTTMWIKEPKTPQYILWHQDGTYLYTEPQSVTGFWFALDDASKENGCLYAIPGGQRGNLKTRFVRDGDGFATHTLEDSDFDLGKAIPLEARKGDLVMLHGRLPHASEYNRSDRSRHAYTLHVIDGTCAYPQENWLQRPSDFPLRGFAS